MKNYTGKTRGILALFLCLTWAVRAADEEPTRSLLLQLEHADRYEQCALEAVLTNRVDLAESILTLLGNDEASQQSVWLLENVTYETALPALEASLKSEDYYIRGAARTVLARYGDCRGVALMEGPLKEYLKKPTHKVTSIYYIGEEDAIDTLEALAEIDCDESTRVLATALDHPSPIIRLRSASALAERGYVSAVPTLIGLLDHTEQAGGGCFRFPTYRAAGMALQRLTYMYHQSVYEIDADEEFKCFDFHRGTDKPLTSPQQSRAGAWKAQWWTWWEAHKEMTRDQWREEAFKWAVDALENPDLAPTAFARLALVGDDEAVRVLQAFAACPDHSEELRADAARTLGEIKQPSAALALRDLLENSPSPDVRFAAADHLEDESRESAAALVKALDDPATRERALGSLRYYRYAEFLPAIEPYLEHDDPDLRELAVWAISGLPSERVEDLFLARLNKEQDSYVINSLLTALGSDGTSNSIPALLEFLKCDDSRMRTEAAWSIEKVAKKDFSYYEGDDKPDDDGRKEIEDWWRLEQARSSTNSPDGGPAIRDGKTIRPPSATGPTGPASGPADPGP